MIDIDAGGPLLRKLKLGRLDPALQNEIVDFADEMGYERTITSEDSLHFIFRIYQAEKAKEKRSRRMLKKAEDLIMKLASLQYETRQREIRSGAKEEKKAPLSRWSEAPITIGKRLTALFESIGITQQATMELIVGIIGERKAVERVELILASNIGQPLAKKLFGARPEALFEPRDEIFLSMISDIETKKEIMDRWSTARDIPEEKRMYNRNPPLLFESHAEISRILGLEKQEASVTEDRAPQPLKEERAKYRPIPMRNTDLWRVLEEFGYELKRHRNEMVFANAEGRTLTIGAPHNRMYDPIVIRHIITDMGTTPEKFEAVRQRVL